MKRIDDMTENLALMCPRRPLRFHSLRQHLQGLAVILFFALALAIVQPARGSDGTDLVEAIQAGDLAKVNELLANGVDPNFRNGRPLSIALNLGHDAVVDALLAAGADPDFRRNEHQEPALFVAVRRGDLESVEKLLRHNADLNITYNDYEVVNAVHWAVMYGTGVQETSRKDGADATSYLAILDRLERAGVNVDALSSFGNTPLAAVINRLGFGGSRPASLFSSGSVEIMKWLLDRGADPNRTARWSHGEQNLGPLLTHILFYIGQYAGAQNESALALIKHLLAAGADPNATDKDGETALDMIADHHLRDTGVIAEIIAAIRAGGGVRSPRLKLLDLDVEAHTNSVVVTWRYPEESNQLTPREGSYRTKNSVAVVLEYREYGSGKEFEAGGRAVGGESDGFGYRRIGTVGVIDGLSPNTVYEIRAQLQWVVSHGAIDMGEWSTVRATTRAPFRVDMKTSRTIDGQKAFAGYVGSIRDSKWLSGDEGTAVIAEGALPGRIVAFAIRARGDDGPGSIPPTDTSFSRDGLTYYAFPGLYGGAEHEMRVVTGWTTGRILRSEKSTYPSLGNSVIDVSEWVSIGPNAPPQFDDADYFQARGILGNRGDHWSTGKRFGDQDTPDISVSAISTDGVLLCDGADRNAPPVRCALPRASDPDGDRLSWWLRRASDKFEIDSRTGEVRTKARGGAAIKQAFPESFKVPTFGFAPEPVNHGLSLVVEDGRGGFDRASFHISFLPSLSIANASGPIQSVPAAPTGLTAVSIGEAVSLSWTAPGGEAPVIDYAVQWKSGGQDYAETREQSGITASGTTVAGLTAGIEYTFRVRARNADGFGPFSEEATGTPKMANHAPTVSVPLSDRVLQIGARADIDISGTFEDLDLDRLTYSVRSSASTIVEARIADDVVAIAAVAEGTATIVVEASDGRLSTIESFEVTVSGTCGSLLEASQEGLVAEVRALIACGADVDEKDGTGRTPLHWASQMGHAGIVDDLLAAGANPSAADDRGFAPETYANAAGHFDIVAALRTAGGPVNGRPMIEPIADLRAVIGADLTVVVSASDADPGQTLSYSAHSGTPDVARVSMNDNRITIVPLVEGTAAITVVVSDGTQSAVESFSVVVSASPGEDPPPNNLPAIEAIDDRRGAIGTDLTVAVIATDADPGDTLSYSARSSDPGVARAEMTDNVITITPVAAGTATIAVEVSDGKQSAVESFELVISQACGSLLRASREGLLAEVRSLIACGADVNEANGSGWTPLHWAAWNGHGEIVDVLLAAGADPGALDKWGNTPAVYARAGGHHAISQRIDAKGRLPNQPDPVNRSPVIEAIDDLRTFVADDGTAKELTVAVSASDADPGDTLSYSVRSSDPGVARAAMTDNVITITPIAGGTTVITAEVSDGTTASTETFKVHVNHPPEILSIADFDVFQGSSVLFETGRVFFDPDGDRLTYSVRSKSPLVRIRESDATFELVALGVAAGPPVWSVTVTLSVSDGINSASSEFTMRVVNRPPFLSGIFDQTVVENCTLTVALSGFDPDITDHTEDLVYTASSSPIDIAQATIPERESMAIKGIAPGKATITAALSDRKDTTTETFLVTVEKNTPPEISPIADQVAYLGPPPRKLRITVDARDPDASRSSECPPLDYEVRSLDTRIATASMSGNEIVITPKRKGTATIVVTVSDGPDPSDSSTVRFKVTVKEGLPVLWPYIDPPLYIVLDPRSDTYRAEGKCAIERKIGEIPGEEPERYSVVFQSDVRGVARVVRSGNDIVIEPLAKGRATVTVRVSDGVDEIIETYDVAVAESMVLLELAGQGNLSKLDALLSVCADPNIQDAVGRTPLHRAARGGHGGAVAALLAASADPNRMNADMSTPLHVAAAAQHLGVVRVLLDPPPGAEYRIEVNKGGSLGNTPLHFAVTVRNLNIAGVLLQAGADPDIPDDVGDTPLHSAVAWGHIELVRLLLGYNADRNAKNGDRKTPLNIAIALAAANAGTPAALKFEKIVELLGGSVPPSLQLCNYLVGPFPVIYPVPCVQGAAPIALEYAATPLSAGAIPIEGPSIAIAGTQVRLNEGTYANATDSGYSVEGTDGGGGALTFNLSGDSRFELVEGRIRIKAGSSFDYETPADREIELTVTAVNASGMTVTATVTVTIADVNEPPVISDIDDQTAVVGNDLTVMVSATDPDGATALRYSARSEDTAVATVSPAQQADLVAGSGVVTVTPLAIGSTSITVSVSDGTIVVTETFDVAVSGGSQQERLDRVSREVLPDALQLIAGSRLQAIAGRFERGAQRSPSRGLPTVEGVVHDIADFLIANETALNEGGLVWEQALAGRSFALGLAGEGSGGPSTVAMWGSGDYRRLSSSGSGVDWDGDILSGHLGVDVAMSSDLRLGLVVDMNRGDFDIRDDSGPGNYGIRMAGLHGYMGRHWNDGSNLWWTTGVAEGEVALSGGGETHERSDVLVALAAGGTHPLTSVGDSHMARPFTLDLKGDISTTTFLDVDVQRARLMMEAAQEFSLAPHGNLTVSGELGARLDRSRSEVESGMELGGHLAWRRDGLTVEGRGRVLMAHEDSRKKEWGIAGSVRLHPDRDGSGLSLRIQPSIGATGSRMSELWHASDSKQLTLIDEDSVARLDSELGYGVRLSEGLLTPYSKVGMTRNGARNYGLGLRLELRFDAHVELEGTHRASPTWTAVDELTLRMRMNW